MIFPIHMSLQNDTLEREGTTAAVQVQLVGLLAAARFILADLAHERVKGVVDAHPRLRRRLDERYTILLCNLTTKT